MRRRAGREGFDISIPRDGGLHDLLQTAARRPSLFDRVIVESISRLSRNSSVAFRVEEELATAGIRLCAADEPLEESFGTIVLRHVNIGIARGYHHELMVKSRQGLETSTRQGWHTGGIAAYGYRFVTHPHPNPHKAKQGALKRTLELDPVRAPVVRRIYDLYLSGGMGLTQIRDTLNLDLDANPPPVKPDPAQSLGQWSRSSIWEMLRNPKYTGYQVWNRRARKSGGRNNPPSAWVWSDEEAHPAIVSRKEFDAVQARAASNHHAASPSPKPGGEGRTPYLYRSLLRCGACGLRMWGKTRPAGVYYQCQMTHQRSKQMPADHPATVHLAESRLNLAVLDFLGTAVFGPGREGYWRHSLTAANEPVAGPARSRMDELKAEIADLNQRLARQVLALESEETTPALHRLVANRVADLERAVRERQERLDRMAAQLPPEPPAVDDVAEMLAKLPILARRLPELPNEQLRAIFESLQLTVTYFHKTHEAEVEIVLRDDGTTWSGDGQVIAVPPVGPGSVLRRLRRLIRRINLA